MVQLEGVMTPKRKEDPTLWDLEEGRAKRDEAMEAVDDPTWKHFAKLALLAVAKARVTVSSDDVWAELDRMGVPRPPEGRAMGPVIAKAIKDGTLLPAGFASGRNPRHHADVMRLYQSAIYGVIR